MSECGTEWEKVRYVLFGKWALLLELLQLIEQERPKMMTPFT
jgi:hypothetical protein